MGLSRHAQTVETRRDKLRAEADRLAGRIDIFVALESPDQAAFALSSEFIDVVDSEATKVVRAARARAFDGFVGPRPRMSPEIRATINAAIDGLAMDINDGLGSYIRKIKGNILSDVSRGASVDAMLATLDTPGARKEFRGSLSRIMSRPAVALLSQIETLVYQDALAQRGAAEGAVPKLVWHTSGDGKVCEDCSPREGQIETAEGWTERGMPGSPILLCSKFGLAQCRCSVDPA